jgi:VanZ family protein
MAVLFVLSSRSDVGPAGRVPDWLTHGIAYLLLAALLCRALAGGLKPLSLSGAAGAVLLATLYGVSDEYHQSFVPGRDASAGDVAKDAAGACVGAWLFRKAVRGRSLGSTTPEESSRGERTPSPNVGRDGVGGSKMNGVGG